ncbi:unnamed protein product, partial [Choristocarpus tenellus]
MNEAVQRAKHEQSESVRLLKKTGEQDFDLPVHWLPTDDDGAGTRTSDVEDNDQGERLGGGDNLVSGYNDLGRLEETHSSSSDSDKEEPGSRRRGWPCTTLTSGNHGNLVS